MNCYNLKIFIWEIQIEVGNAISYNNITYSLRSVYNEINTIQLI